jgi:hypothetical protein
MLEFFIILNSLLTTKHSQCLSISKNSQLNTARFCPLQRRFTVADILFDYRTGRKNSLANIFSVCYLALYKEKGYN